MASSGVHIRTEGIFLPVLKCVLAAKPWTHQTGCLPCSFAQKLARNILASLLKALRPGPLIRPGFLVLGLYHVNSVYG